MRPAGLLLGGCRCCGAVILLSILLMHYLGETDRLVSLSIHRCFGPRVLASADQCPWPFGHFFRVGSCNARHLAASIQSRSGTPVKARPNPSIERASSGRLRLPTAAAHVER